MGEINLREMDLKIFRDVMILLTILPSCPATKKKYIEMRRFVSSFYCFSIRVRVKQSFPLFLYMNISFYLLFLSILLTPEDKFVAGFPLKHGKKKTFPLFQICVISFFTSTFWQTFSIYPLTGTKN